MFESLRVRGGVPGNRHREAQEALKKAKEVVELLDRAFTLMAEDDPAQPASAHIYAALWEAAIRANTLEDWYDRTYGPPAESPRKEGVYGTETSTVKRVPEGRNS
ncbi:MAG: hypothetical protein H0V83_11560 [Rubrobacter sp.]|nr:hypothetical protein [Rubrobacter sp.]